MHQTQIIYKNYRYTHFSFYVIWKAKVVQNTVDIGRLLFLYLGQKAWIYYPKLLEKLSSYDLKSLVMYALDKIRVMSVMLQ